MKNLNRTLLGVSACAVLAFPAAAIARGGQGHDHSQRSHGGKQNAHAIQSHGHRHDRNTIFRGTVASVTDNVVTVDVTAGNRFGRKFADQPVQFDVSSARLRVADTNGDGKRDISDVVQGDAVLVQAGLPRKADVTQPIAARRLLDKGAPAPDDTQTEQPEQG